MSRENLQDRSLALREYTERYCDGTLSAEQTAELERSLRDDPSALDAFVLYMEVHSQIAWNARAHAKDEHDQPPAVENAPSTPFPSLSTTHYPLPADFVGSWAFACMVATVIMGVMLLGLWAIKVTHHQPQVAEAPSKSVPSDARPEFVFVGRITGLLDVKWSDDKDFLPPHGYAYVPLDHKYKLDSGLMEITYDTGAKVILQGPCTYEVESRAGGYLALGKLTAKVVSGQGSVASAKPQAANHKSEIINHKSNPQSLIPSPLFAIRTPTAIVTDLGTEFGVEVGKEGSTKTQVFAGSIRLAASAAGGDEGGGQVLRAGQTGAVQPGNPAIIVTDAGTADAKQFVRAMPPPKAVRDSQSYAELVLSLNPVVYYRMEQPAKKGTGPIGAKHPPGRSGQLDLSPFSLVFDSAPGGHHGELRLGNEYGGSPYRSGRFGNSLDFRGPEVGDGVIVHDYPKAANDRLTVAAWIWVVATGRSYWPMIASNWSAFSSGRGGALGDRGQFHFGLYDRDGNLIARVTQRDGQMAELREGASQPLPLFVWQHVVLVADGTTMHLYRNGKEVASGPCAGVLPQPPTAGLGIGCRTNEAGTDPLPDTPGAFYWQGRIDEFAVFNQALSAETVEQLYLGKTLQDHPTSKGDQPMNGP
ncbi:MAG: LamG domain-containing protein [Planctomycetales bacterium]|nr:LamG domain-containing protein [Planctomycetales bacterium]